MFAQYILPKMSTPREDWDNTIETKDEGGVVVESFEGCKAVCEAKPDCRQYALNADSLCVTRSDPRLGKAAAGVRSGWLLDRVLQFEKDMAPCGSEAWLTPPRAAGAI